MSALPFDLPTLRHHYGYFTINDKQIPILYRLISIFLFFIHVDLCS